MTPVDPDRWTRVTALFHGALERPPSEREAFLDGACAGDLALCAEVRSLLARHHSGDGFLDTPLAAAHPELLEDDPGVSVPQLGPYRVKRELGRGGMGVVYLAEDTSLGREVALKVLSPRFTGDPTQRERLRREARAVAALSHPNIAAVHALAEVDDQLYIVGEFVRGRTLREELRGGPLPSERLLETARSVADALASAHASGVIHRDLKPENVIRSEAGAPKLVDFGLARIARAAGDESTALTQSGAIVGTPAYMSPEQIRRAPVDFRTDLFSFGVLLYELATGVNPFAGADPVSTIAHILERDPPSLTDIRPRHGEGLARIVDRCLRKNPEERYASTADLVRDLDALRRGVVPAPLPAADRSRALWWWQAHQVTVAAVLLLLLYPVDLARGWLPGFTGLALFLGCLATAATSVTLRLHLAFTSRVFPSELARQRRWASPAAAVVDVLFAALALAMGIGIAAAHTRIGALLVSAAVALALVAGLVEPATTRAAHGGRTS